MKKIIKILNFIIVLIIFINICCKNVYSFDFKCVGTQQSDNYNHNTYKYYSNSNNNFALFCIQPGLDYPTNNKTPYSLHTGTVFSDDVTKDNAIKYGIYTIISGMYSVYQDDVYGNTKDYFYTQLIINKFLNNKLGKANTNSDSNVTYPDLWNGSPKDNINHAIDLATGTQEYGNLNTYINIAHTAYDEYTNLAKGSFDFNQSNLNFDLVNEKYEEEITLTNTTNYEFNYSLIIGGTEYNTHITKNGNNLKISIPQSLINDTTTVEIKAQISKTFHLPNVYTSTGKYQKVVSNATDITDKVITRSTSASGTITPNGKLTIHKINELTKANIEGASFNLYKNEGCNSNLIASGSTDSNGKLPFDNLTIGSTYYYKETNAPSGYVTDSSCKSVTISSATTEIEVTNKMSNRTLTIKKVNSKSKEIVNKPIEFSFYHTSDCSGEAVKIVKTNTDGKGELNITLSPSASDYYMKETDVEKPYVVSDACIKVGKMQSKLTLSPIINKTECEIDFEKDSSIKNRLELYKKYEYRNLLNFDGKTSASEACSNPNLEYNKTEGCLYVKSVGDGVWDKFNSGDLSYYNEILNSSNPDSQAYCLTKVDGYLEEAQYKSPVKAGQMVLEFSKDPSNTTSAFYIKMSRKCFVYDESGSNVIEGYNLTNINDKEYIDDIIVDNKSLDYYPAYMTNKSLKKEGVFYKVEVESEDIYFPNPVYAEIITGRTCIPNTSNELTCKLIGYGVASKFKDAKTGNGSFNFKIEPGTKNKFDFNDNNVCEYEVDPEIIKYSDDDGKLQLEFRIIDTKVPFNRNTKSNWCDGTNCTSDNNVVQNVIKNRTNSYGLKNSVKQEPKYKITLIPSDIQKIRTYNKDNKYDDYNIIKVKINNKETIVNRFLYNLQNGELKKYDTNNKEIGSYGLLNKKLSITTN